MNQQLYQYETQSIFSLGIIILDDDVSGHVSLEEIQSGLECHAKGDWGYVPEDTAIYNDQAVKNGKQIISAFGEDEKTFLIVTEANRSKTTVQFPIQF